MPPRIHADFNSFAGHGSDCAVMLDGFSTLRDLSFYGIRLSEGMRLTVWDPSDDVEDLQVDASLYFLQGRWMAGFRGEELKDVPAGDRSEHPFLCYSCRADLSESFRSFLRDSPMVCPACGKSLLIPIAAPEKIG